MHATYQVHHHTAVHDREQVLEEETHVSVEGLGQVVLLRAELRHHALEHQVQVLDRGDGGEAIDRKESGEDEEERTLANAGEKRCGREPSSPRSFWRCKKRTMALIKSSNKNHEYEASICTMTSFFCSRQNTMLCSISSCNGLTDCAATHAI